MRGTLRGVRTRVERLVADVQRRSDEPDWEQIIAILHRGRRRAREQANPATRPTHEERLADGRARRARRLRKAGHL